MSQVTVTGKVGPGSTVTSLVIADVDSFEFKTNEELLVIKSKSKIQEFDIAAATTITVTVSGSTYTVVVS